MTEIHGVTGKPYAHPEVRRKLPEPYARQRIDLDGGKRVKRRWQDVSVFAVAKGDIVANFGLVAEDPEEIVNIPGAREPDEFGPRWSVKLVNVDGVEQVFPGHERLYAFAPEGVKRK